MAAIDTIKARAVALGRTLVLPESQCLPLFLSLGIVSNETNALVSWEGNHINHWRSLSIAEGMYRPLACR
mgnify:CR=1 FL=1